MHVNDSSSENICGEIKVTSYFKTNTSGIISSLLSLSVPTLPQFML